MKKPSFSRRVSSFIDISSEDTDTGTKATAITLWTIIFSGDDLDIFLR